MTLSVEERLQRLLAMQLENGGQKKPGRKSGQKLASNPGPRTGVGIGGLGIETEAKEKSEEAKTPNRLTPSGAGRGERDKIKVVHRYSQESWNGLVTKARAWKAEETKRRINDLMSLGGIGGGRISRSEARGMVGDERKVALIGGGRSVGEWANWAVQTGVIKGIDTRPDWVKLDEIERLEWELAEADRILRRNEKSLAVGGERIKGGASGIGGGKRGVVRWRGPVWWEERMGDEDDETGETVGEEGRIRGGASFERITHAVMLPSAGVEVIEGLCDKVGMGKWGRKGWSRKGGASGVRLGYFLECVGIGWIQ